MFADKNTKYTYLALLPCILIALSCASRQIHPETHEYSVTFVAVGDNLINDTLLNAHRRGNTWDFTPIYTEIRSIVKKADLAFINQETVMAGERFGYSGYPAFNTPQSLAAVLADTGFTIVNQANNHAMDMGRTGLYAALDLWNAMEKITVVGAQKSGESRRIITKNTITFGLLSYTYGLNGLTLPPGEPNLVSLIHKDRMAREMDALRPLCDFLIVSMHWGDEYQMQPSRE